MKKKSDGAEILLESITKGIFEKKGLNVLKIDLRKLDSRITDYFIICHAQSGTQVSAICDSVEDTVRKDALEKPLHVEGLDNCFWVLLDYGNVIVHIFLEKTEIFIVWNHSGLTQKLRSWKINYSKLNIYGRRYKQRSGTGKET